MSVAPVEACVGHDHAVVPHTLFASVSASLGDGLLQRGASGELHTVASGDLDLFAGAGVTAGAGGALNTLDGEQTGHLDGLALSQGLNEDGLEGGQGLVGLRLGQVGAFGNLSDKLGTVHGH